MIILSLDFSVAINPNDINCGDADIFCADSCDLIDVQTVVDDAETYLLIRILMK